MNEKERAKKLLEDYEFELFRFEFVNSKCFQALARYIHTLAKLAEVRISWTPMIDSNGIADFLVMKIQN